MTNFAYLSFKKDVPARGYWDQEFLNDLLSDIANATRAAFIIPGAYQGHLLQEICEYLYQFKKILLFITSDEEGKFPVDKLQHPNMIAYSQYGTSKNVFPLGYTPHTRPILKDIGPLPKERDWFFSGQVTHQRRQLMAAALEGLPNGVLNKTDGFAKGMKHWDYFHHIGSSHAVICPPGAVTQDSFRVYETLEAGSIPIVDALTPDGKDTGYWQKLFPDAPFPIIGNYYYEVPRAIEKCRDPHYANQVFAWWIREKIKIKNRIKKEMGVEQDNVTVVIPTSPIPSHPDTRVIDETIKSVRHHFKGSPIIVTIDGVRPEQEKQREDYEKFIRNFLWKCNFEYENVIPVIHDEFKHQSGMLKEVMPMIQTPLMMYVEHDTPLTTDRDLELSFLKANIITGKAHVIRFHFEEVIPEPHKHLMIGEPDDGLLKTVQWSQRPHLASTAFYRNALQFFSPDAQCFIEDLFYGKLIQAWDEQGIEGWKKWKLWIYHPEGGIKRSLNLDGREGTKKFDDRQIW
jgi:hypothetical protein